ncbi:glycerate kinase [uncultured Eudoraea sp.]|uniref:glycerate kinase n=1 Tax=uncultured Eudoraea sp. TaxID=1035614 RepID=UPI002618AF0D|nr:glycerate kinase [uncultured Eudoraea sp.]
MNFLLVPDKFKGSLTAKQVIAAISRAVSDIYPQAGIYSVAASDGGDGFLDSVRSYMQVETVKIDTTGPLGRKISTEYLINPRTDEAYIELAKASGLELLSDEERNPLLTSTMGTGIQIKDAILKGAEKIYIGLGGSATNDAGMGIAAACGFAFLDEFGNSLNPIGKNLSKINTIKSTDFLKDYQNLEIYAVNDVDNPLFGPKGAACIYAAQKGAAKEDIEFLDNGLKHLHTIVKEVLGKDYAEIPGSGAAGGTAYGLKTFLNAEFIGGTDFVFKLAKIDKLLESNSIDFIITGEGKIDEQTLRGKLIHGVCRLGKSYNIPVLVVCGVSEINKKDLMEMGDVEVIEIREPSKPLSYSIENASDLIELATTEFFKNRIK